MIVQCPSCASRYRVNDANVPSSGGKITCPSCQHKFIVYPEEQAPAAGGGADSNDLEDKTSVAFRPDLNKLVNQMQGGQGGGGDDGVAATEVMSGDSIPDFLAGQDLAGDGTVEMQNPFDGGGSSGNQNAMGGGGEDAMATEVVSGDMLDGLGFEEQKRQPPKPQSAPAKPPRTPQNQIGQQNRAPQQQPNQQNQAPQQPNQQNQSNQPSPASPQPPASPAQPNNSQPSQPSQPAAGQPASPNAAEASFEHADGPAGPNPQHDGPWKLKTNFGLTYEFPDTKSLSNWLSNREDLDGYSLSGDGENFHGLDEWPQISGGGAAAPPQQTPSFQQSTSPAPQQPPSGPGAGANNAAGGGSGAAGMPGNPLTTNDPPPQQPAPPNPSTPTGKKIQPNEYRPPSRDGKWNVLLWGVAFLLMLVVGALSVQLFGIFDIKGELLGMKSPQAENQAPEQPEAAPEQAASGGEEAPEEEANKPDPKITKEVTRLVTDARRAVENNRLQTAAEKLQNAKLLDPKRVEVYELLATVYGEMGQEKEAEAAKEKVNELKAAAQGNDGSPGGDEVAGEEASKN